MITDSFGEGSFDYALHRKESLQLAFDFFDVWDTKFTVNGLSTTGKLTHQHTDHIIEKLKGVFPLKNKRVLELGSHEGGHSFLLSRLGATVVGLEGRVANYVKSCMLKNILDAKGVRFYLEDLRKPDLEKFGMFDFCLCSGLLYHLLNPQDVLQQIPSVTSHALINTHYLLPEHVQ